MEPLGSHLLVILSDPQLREGFLKLEDHHQQSQHQPRLRLAIASILRNLAESLAPLPRTEKPPVHPLIAAWQR
jgi:hypothetical protein